MYVGVDVDLYVFVFYRLRVSVILHHTAKCRIPYFVPYLAFCFIII